MIKKIIRNLKDAQQYIDLQEKTPHSETRTAIILKKLQEAKKDITALIKKTK